MPMSVSPPIFVLRACLTTTILLETHGCVFVALEGGQLMMDSLEQPVSGIGDLSPKEVAVLMSAWARLPAVIRDELGRFEEASISTCA